MDKILNVALYIRVSTEEQARHGYSLNSQEERGKEYCKLNNFKIYDIYRDEGKSARSNLKQRKELLRLIEDVKNKKIDHIVFWRLDRWFRNIKDYYKIQDILDTYKVTWSCTDEDYNTTTSNGRLHLNIKLSIAQNESDQTSDRIKFNFENRIKNKKAIFGTKALPLGYKVENKIVIKDKNEEEIVIDMFNHFKIFHSLQGTATYLNNKYNKTFDYIKIKRCLQNLLYTGVYRNITNYCEPYILQEQFEENKNIIKNNIKENTKKYDYIFKGLIKCSCCSHKMSSGTKISYGKNKKWRYRVYRCKYTIPKLCNNTSAIYENKLEKYLIANFVSLFNEHIEEQKNEIKLKKESNIDINKLKLKLEKLTELYIEDRITKEKYNNDYNLISEQINSYKPKKEKIINIENIVDNNAIKLYNKLTDNKLKRAFWAEYIDYIERDKDLNFKVYFKK